MPDKKTVSSYIAALPNPQRGIAERLRKLVAAAAPQSVASFKWAQPVFEDHGPFAYLKAAKAHVTFGFWRGAELDPDGAVLSTSGTKMAHLKLRSTAEIDEQRLSALVKRAVALNRAKGDPTKGQ
jgi:hypothetical protein